MSKPLPLAGIRILEFSQAVLGPTCGMLLADFGAEVIKIEPVEGDNTRNVRGFGVGFVPYLSRNHKSLAIDLKSEAGKTIIHGLLQTTDVIIENFGPGAMERLGFGYTALAEQHPRLIYCSLKGFMPGPYEHRMALDEVVQMMSGLAYMTGPPGNPLRAGASITDMMTGVYGVIGVLLALNDRHETGQGAFVKSTLFETAVSVMGLHMAAIGVSGKPLPPMPARDGAWGIYHKFEVAQADMVFIGVTTDQQWVRFCQAFDRPDLLADERLATRNGRVELEGWLLPELRKMFITMSKDEVMQRCERARVSFAPIAHPEELFDDPQLNEGGFLLETTLLDGRKLKLPRPPLIVGDYDFGLRLNPPQIGEHTDSLLQELGYSGAEIEHLVTQKVIATVK